MPSYLFTWNPAKWDWKTLDQDVDACRRKGVFDDQWSCGVTKKIQPGDRVFLIKLGSEEPTGLLASGYALSAPFSDAHFTDPRRKALYIKLRYDVLLNPSSEALLSREDLKSSLPEVHWSPQASGISIPGESAAALEEMWKAHLNKRGLAPMSLAEEVISPERFWEGATRRITVDAYERNPRARKACLAHHGHSCLVCGFSFEARFGKIGAGFIHVHHVRPLSEVGEEYEVDPIKDMIPVCPNCHSMIHQRKPAFSIEEIKSALRSI
jgi:5-methylcytosine-specific restriction protein A